MKRDKCDLCVTIDFLQTADIKIRSKIKNMKNKLFIVFFCSTAQQEKNKGKFFFFLLIT